MSDTMLESDNYEQIKWLQYIIYLFKDIVDNKGL